MAVAVAVDVDRARAMARVRAMARAVVAVARAVAVAVARVVGVVALIFSDSVDTFSVPVHGKLSRKIKALSRAKAIIFLSILIMGVCLLCRIEVSFENFKVLPISQNHGHPGFVIDFFFTRPHHNNANQDKQRHSPTANQYLPPLKSKITLQYVGNQPSMSAAGGIV